jgi:hypothetical protein
MTRDAALATRIFASPLGPKSRLKVECSSPRCAYGEEIAASKPPVVASEGRAPFSISVSGLAELSERQNATSSAISAAAVPPRMVRKLAGLHSMSTRVLKLIVSLVWPVTSF